MHLGRSNLTCDKAFWSCQLAVDVYKNVYIMCHLK